MSDRDSVGIITDDPSADKSEIVAGYTAVSEVSFLWVSVCARVRCVL
jgi:hypothetical protein